MSYDGVIRYTTGAQPSRVGSLLPTDCVVLAHSALFREAGQGHASRHAKFCQCEGDFVTLSVAVNLHLTTAMVATA